LARWEFRRGRSATARDSWKKDYWPDHAKKNLWIPEDLTAEVWSGTSLYKLGGVGRALREFRIPHNVVVKELGRAKILVHPEDEEDARTIVHEVIEGAPPEQELRGG
jgi:hypothetical protein